MTQFHYVYKISSPSGKFYIGRHTTSDLDDGYIGSGLWVQGIKDKSRLKKEIIEFANSFEDLCFLEEKYINENINHPDNMNFNNKPVGWPTGDLNWNRTEEAKLSKQKRMLGISYNERFGSCKANLIKEKISKSKLGKSTGKAWNKGLTKETDSRVLNQALAISKSVQQWMNTLPDFEKREKFGNPGDTNGFYGKTHSDETLQSLREKQKNLRAQNRKTCPHCSKNVDAPNYARYHGDKCKSL